MQDLGVLSVNAVARDVSGDGSVVVGNWQNSTTQIPFLWTSELGMVNVSTYLTSLGVPLGGQTLLAVMGVSDDGSAITGTGRIGNSLRAWIVTGLPLGGRCPCRADFGCDASFGSQDLFDFIAALLANDRAADFNRDSVLNSQDFFEYITAFFDGCD